MPRASKMKTEDEMILEGIGAGAGMTKFFGSIGGKHMEFVDGENMVPRKSNKMEVRKLNIKRMESRLRGRDRFKKKLSKYKHLSNDDLIRIYNKQVTKTFEDF